jgi:hypothetical protein
MSRVVMWIVIVSVALLLGALIVCLSGLVGLPMRYDIDSSVRGWVVVEYEDTSCNKLARDGLFLVVMVPASGRACTASTMPKGWRWTKFDRIRADGNREGLSFSSTDPQQLIWAWATGTQGDSTRREREIFFVGTKKELDSAWDQQFNLLTSPKK